MEDKNMLAVDCIVLSCCCQCLILQILIFILLKLPRKLVKKTREYAKKFRARKKATKTVQMDLTASYGEESFRSLGSSFRIDVKDVCVVESLRFGCCMDEIDSFFHDFSSRGEFGFGSFWMSSSSAMCLRSCLKEEQLGYDDVRFRLMELFGDSKISCH